jgi:hypothetical protein
MLQKKEMKFILVILLAFAGSFTANAQIGWTLNHCRQKFGMDTDPDMNVRHFKLNYNAYVSDGLHSWSGRQISLTVDPDGTVGGIQWLKFGSPFSETEIQQHLQDASRVTWERKPSSQKENLLGRENRTESSFLMLTRETMGAVHGS